MMITMNEMDEGETFPRHSHPHEEAKYVIRGTLEMTTGSGTKVLKPGSALIISGNEPHSARVLGPGSVVYVNVFSPPRNDYVAARKGKDRTA
jgi:quercetin dioxygenase-like cupin family protein